MDKHYDISWLTESTDNGEHFKFLLFWGHTSKQDAGIDKVCFSQWYPAAFTIEGVVYKTAEHWMMAQKALLFDDAVIFEQVIACENPAEAKKLGRDIVGYNDEEWNRNKYAIVRLGNIHKFNQNPELAAYLLNTGDRVLVEASPVDQVWGIGLAADSKDAENVYGWRGKNLLGFALMEARDFLRDFGLFEPLADAMEPPWLRFPGVHPDDEFWHKGKGEAYIKQLSKYFTTLDDRQRQVYMLTRPQPYEWMRFYGA